MSLNECVRKSLSFRSIIILLILFTVASAQIPEHIQRYRNDLRGDVANRKTGLMDGNQVRTIFWNNGEVSDWYSGVSKGPHLEWPKGTGHRHLDGFTFMVGAKVQIIDALGQARAITPIEISYREEMDFDPVTRDLWGFEPISGYAHPSKTTPAMSNDTQSFPITWPAALGLGADWNRKWYGYFGKGSKDSVLETFFVMDDSKDGEFNRLPYSFYPIASDSSRGGLGLRVEVRSLQFKHTVLEDIIFWNYDVTNISDRTYDTTSFGFFCDPSVGSSNQNSAGINSLQNLVYLWAPSGIGLPDNYKTGYAGITVMQDSGISSISNIGSFHIGLLSDKGPSGVWPKNDQIIWNKMTSGSKDTSIQNTNISAVLGSSIFSFPKWSTRRYSVAMVMGDDLASVVTKTMKAELFYRNKFVLSDSLLSVGEGELLLTSVLDGYSLSQNYPNPFNPVTTIRFSIPEQSSMDLSIYDLLGKRIAVLASGRYDRGEYAVQWDASSFASGMYWYQLRAGNTTITKKLLFLQ